MQFCVDPTTFNGLSHSDVQGKESQLLSAFVLFSSDSAGIWSKFKFILYFLRLPISGFLVSFDLFCFVLEILYYSGIRYMLQMYFFFNPINEIVNRKPIRETLEKNILNEFTVL